MNLPKTVSKIATKKAGIDCVCTFGYNLSGNLQLTSSTIAELLEEFHPYRTNHEWSGHLCQTAHTSDFVTETLGELLRA